MVLPLDKLLTREELAACMSNLAPIFLLANSASAFRRAGVHLLGIPKVQCFVLVSFSTFSRTNSPRLLVEVRHNLIGGNPV